MPGVSSAEEKCSLSGAGLYCDKTGHGLGYGLDDKPACQKLHCTEKHGLDVEVECKKKGCHTDGLELDLDLELDSYSLESRKPAYPKATPSVSKSHEHHPTNVAKKLTYWDSYDFNHFKDLSPETHYKKEDYYIEDPYKSNKKSYSLDPYSRSHSGIKHTSKYPSNPYSLSYSPKPIQNPYSQSLYGRSYSPRPDIYSRSYSPKPSYAPKTSYAPKPS